ncbi:MAG: PGF-CTERM sorting domain-containing protein [Candidatus Methanoperedens sp.]|nr:PGF-CTERM sorting domain-containing protein [Candidatus Methanoperedens sp.]MCZ7369529.1 PGF-CTERM sorting domain-containing protein [Candidatus Methanoperedens sp.]
MILATPALSQNETTPAQTTTAPTVVATTAVPTVVVTTAAPTATTTQGKFRVGPSVTLRPVTDVIETDQDGIVELFMNNPSLNDVTLNVDARISVPAGIHVYGQSFGEAAGAGVVSGTFSVPPGTARTIAVVIKADKSARIGSHTIQFTGLYYPGDNKDAYQPLSLTYSVTVKAASKNPESAEPTNPKAVPTGAETPKVQLPGFGAVLAIFGVFAIARILSRKK